MAWKVRLCLATSMVAFTAEARAQEVPDIVVTAQKRAQSLQEVPISIQVLSADDLRTGQFKGVESLDSLSPSITFARSYNPNANAITIRGIGTQVSNDGAYIQQDVIVNLDGVPVSRAAGFWTSLPDVERLEILRGPQGTLFGKNAVSGVLNVTTRAPSEEFGGMVDASFADDGGYSGAASVTGLIPGIKTRLTSWVGGNPGWGKNYGPVGENAGFSRSFGVRGKVGFDVTPDVSVLVTGSYSYERTTNQWFLQTVNNSGAPGSREDVALLPVVAGPHNHEINTNSDPAARIRSWSMTGQLDWNLSDSTTLTAISNYSKYKLRWRTDVDQVPLPFTVASLQLMGFLSDPGSITIQDGHEFSQELRIHGKYGPLDLTFGGYYSDFTEDYQTQQLQMTLAAPVPRRDNRVVYYRNKSSAVFFDGELSLADSFKILGGVRYTHEGFKFTYQRDNSTPLATVIVGPFAGTPSDDGISARAGVRWEATPHVNLYATYSRGYKGPALDLSNSLRAPDKVLISPEYANSYEIGLKSTLFDRRLRLNAALFRTDISDFQAFKIVPPVGTQLVSAGDVRSQGFELDGNLTLSDTLGINFGLVYDDGTYRNTTFTCYPGQTVALGCAIDLDGNGAPESQSLTGKPLAVLPKWKATLGANLSVPLGSSGMEFYAHPSVDWQSKVQFSITQDPRTIRPSVAIVDLTLGVRSPDQGWDVSLFAKNLTNEFYYGRLQFVQAIGGTYHSLSREYHRYVGLRATFRWGGER